MAEIAVEDPTGAEAGLLQLLPLKHAEEDVVDDIGQYDDAAEDGKPRLTQVTLPLPVNFPYYTTST